MAITDLCALEDVLRYLPGYQSNENVEDTLEALISAESQAIEQETGRQIIPFADQPETRAFTLDHHQARLRKREIGDLASAGDTDITVEIVTADETSTTTIDRAQYRPLYETRRQPTRSWEPVTALEFPTALGGPGFAAGQTLLITGNWGFPEVPIFIREACAKRVILRYASDVAQAGTQIAQAIAEINLAGLFASARDDVERLNRRVMIA